MKVLARWGFIFVVALAAGSYGIQTQVEEASALANNSQIDNQIKSKPVENFISENTGPIDNVIDLQSEMIMDQTKEQTDDKKLVKKTAIVEKTSATRSFRATAYCLKGRTANGGSVRRGIVAADPRVLPLGTRIYVNAGAYSGYYTVTDTGGVIKGNILDVWVPSCAEAMRFGRRSVTVAKTN